MVSTLEKVRCIADDVPDTALIVAASWEDRCLGVSDLLDANYRADCILITEYDGKNDRRTTNLARLRDRLDGRGITSILPASHADPLQNVRDTVGRVASFRSANGVRLTIDVSCFTRKHLLQLLHGLDIAGLLSNARFLYSQPEDYHTSDNEPRATGVSSVEAIRSFAGLNRPSRDSLLILFLSYEGRRAEALWEHLEPNQAILVVADPPYQPRWIGRAEEQNRYLLSVVPPERVMRSSASEPSSTVDLLESLKGSERFSSERFNYRIAPLGTKGQLLGVYRFWRNNPMLATLMYVSPMRYRDDRPQYPVGRVLCLDATQDWPDPPFAFRREG